MDEAVVLVLNPAVADPGQLGLCGGEMAMTVAPLQYVDSVGSAKLFERRCWRALRCIPPSSVAVSSYSPVAPPSWDSFIPKIVVIIVYVDDE